MTSLQNIYLFPFFDDFSADIPMRQQLFCIIIQQQFMLRKRNYKEEDHFSHYYSVFIPRSNGTKFTLYFKRYRPAESQATLYEVLHNKVKQSAEQKSLYPIDRTLEVISFDGKLDICIPFFKKIGKIRKFVTGQTKYSNKQAYYCIIIFKYEFDLVKCFRDQYFQEVINRENNEGRANQEEKEAYNAELIANYMGEELKQIDKLQELHKEGYNVVTNKLGQYKFDYQANQKLIQDLPQVKRRKKQEQKTRKIKQADQES